MKTTYVIHQLQTGYQMLDQGLYATFRKGLGTIIEHPVFAFLLEGGGKKILVDTGMSDTENSVAYHHNGRQDAGQAIHEQLASIGVSVEEIDAVIFTHLHWDHCYNMERFTNATFYASKTEYEFAMNPVPPYWASYEHPLANLKAPFRDLPFTLFEGDTELFDGITAYPTPGHSPGHVAVAVNTEKGLFSLVGDLMFVRENFEEDEAHGWPLTPPGRFCSFVDIWESMEKVILRSDYVLMTHDPEQMGIPSFPNNDDEFTKVPEKSKTRVKNRLEHM